MAELYNFNNGRLEIIPDDQVENAVTSGEYGFKKGQRVPVYDLNDQKGSLSAEDALRAFQDKGSGFRYRGAEETRQAELQEKYGNLPEQIKTLGESVARTATFGASDIISQELGIAEKEAIAGRKEANPVTAITGEIATVLASLVSGPGAAAKAIQKGTGGIRALEKAGEITAKKLLNNKIRNKTMEKALKGGIKGSIEGGAFSAGNYVSEESLGDANYNAEALISRVGQGAALGGVIGGSLMGGMHKSKKALDKIKQRVSDDLKKFSGAMGDEGLSVATTINKLQKTKKPNVVKQPYILAQIDDETGQYVYQDKTKKAFIDPNEIQGNGFDLGNTQNISELGRKVGIDGLAEKIDIEKVKSMGLRDYLSQLKSTETQQTSKALTAQRDKLIARKEQLGKGYRRLKAERAKLLQQLEKVGEKPSLRTRLNTTTKKLNKILGDFRKASDDITALKSEFAGVDQISAIQKQIDNVLAEYPYLKIGNQLIITDPLKAASSIQRAVTKQFIDPKLKPGEADLAALKAAGAMKTAFKKMSPQRIKEMAEFIRGNFKNRGKGFKALFTEIDDLFDNVKEAQIKSITTMDDAVIEAQNLIDANNIQTSLTGEKLAQYVEKTWFKKFIDPKTGKPIPGFAKELDRIADFADDMRTFRSVETGVGKPKQIPFSAQEYRSLRQQYDQILNFDKEQNFFKEMIKDVRFKMEEELIDFMDKVDGAKIISDKYRGGKKIYGLSAETLKLIDDKMAREASNNGISLTGYISGGIGAGIAGVPGALLGIATRKFTQNYGDNIVALSANRILKDADTLNQKIATSVGNFLKKGSKPVRATAVKLGVNQLDYEKEADELAQKTTDIDSLTDGFVDNNGPLIESAPETATMLQDKMTQSIGMLDSKFPKPPADYPEYKKWQPPKSELQRYAKYKRAIENPTAILEDMQNGYISNESIEVLQTIYPGIYSKIQEEMLLQISDGRKISYRQRVYLSRMFGINMDYHMNPRATQLLQMNNQQIEQQRQAEETIANAKMKPLSKEFAGREQTESIRILSK